MLTPTPSNLFTCEKCCLSQFTLSGSAPYNFIDMQIDFDQNEKKKNHCEMTLVNLNDDSQQQMRFSFFVISIMM